MNTSSDCLNYSASVAILLVGTTMAFSTLISSFNQIRLLTQPYEKFDFIREYTSPEEEEREEELVEE